VSAGARRWFKLGGLHSGQAIGDVYHYIAKNAKATACGIVLPESYGRFWASPGKRCVDCLIAKKVEKAER